MRIVFLSFLLCVWMCHAACALAVSTEQAGSTGEPRIGVLTVPTTGFDSIASEQLITALKHRGMIVRRIGRNDLVGASSIERLDVLVIPDAPHAPVRLAPALLHWVTQGKSLALLGGFAFSDPSVFLRGGWFARSRIDRWLSRREPGDHSLDMFNARKLKQWTPVKGPNTTRMHLSATSGPNGTHAVRLTIQDFEQYAKIHHVMHLAGASRTTGVALWVRSDPRTYQVELEVMTRDHQRWNAVFDTTPKWQMVSKAWHNFAPMNKLATQAGRLNPQTIEAIEIGLSRWRTTVTGKDHTIDLAGLQLVRKPLPSSHAFDAMELGHPVDAQRLSTIDSLKPTASLAAGQNPIQLQHPVTGYVPFGVPRAGQSALIPLWIAKASGCPVICNFAHIHGPFRGSDWLLAGIAQRTFYRSPRVIAMLARSIKRLAASNKNASAARCVVSDRDLAKTIGVTHAGGKYHFTDKNFLIEGSDQLLSLGVPTIKLWLGKLDKTYAFNTHWPKVHRLVDVVKTPAFRKVLGEPFKTYIFESFAVGVKKDWKQGLSDAQASRIENQFYELTKYLLMQYRGSGKTFVLQNWESDWAIRDRANVNAVPSSTQFDRMIRWLNARQRGVARARQEVGEHGVRVLYAVEVNRVWRSIQFGIPSVTTQVLPYVKMDLASYSSYDTEQEPDRFRAALRFIAEHVKSAGATKPRVYVGEYGTPENEQGAAAQLATAKNVLEVAGQFGCPYIVYWELYGNEAVRTPVKANADVHGYWLIRPDGTRSPVWQYFRTLLIHTPHR